MLGSDIFPSDITETMMSAIGLFVGGLINANIFGELAMIFSELDKKEKEFQSKFGHPTGEEKEEIDPGEK